MYPNFEQKFEQNLQELQENREELNQIISLANEEISSKQIANDVMGLDEVSDALRVKMEQQGLRSFRFERMNNCAKKFRFFLNF